MISVDVLDKEVRGLEGGDIVLFQTENPYMIISRHSGEGLEYNMINLKLGKLSNSIWYKDIKMVTADFYDISKIYRGEDEIKLILGGNK